MSIETISLQFYLQHAGVVITLGAENWWESMYSETVLTRFPVIVLFRDPKALFNNYTMSKHNMAYAKANISVIRDMIAL